jgi:hypothetical protein
MIFEETVDDEADDFLDLDESVDEFDWDDDTLLSLDEEMAAQGGDDIFLDFDPGKSDLGDYWSACSCYR